MKDWFSTISFSNICHFRNCIIYDFSALVDFFIFTQISVYDHIWSNKVIVP